MAFFRGKKKRQNSNKESRRPPQPVRYYRSRSSRIDKTLNSVDKKHVQSKSSKLTVFIKLLPQRLLFIAIVVLIFLNTTISSFGVKIQNDAANQYRSLDEYTSGVETLMGSSFLNFSKLTFNSTLFESQITEMFPEVFKASVVVPLAGRKLSIGLQMDEPLLRLKSQGSKQGIVGKTGKLLILTDTNTVLSSFSAFPSIFIEPAVDFVAGDQVFTSLEMKLISLLVDEFDGSTGYRPEISSIIFQVKQRQMQVSFKQASFYAKLTPERDSDLQIGSLIATLKQLDEQGSGSVPTEYIDVRVEDRVFVK